MATSGLFVEPSTGAVSAGTWSFRNALINGSFLVNQRGTSTNLAAMSSVATVAPGGWVADRWNVLRGGYAANMVVALGTVGAADLPFTDAGLTKFARLQRVAGDTSTQALNMQYNLETQDSVPFAGKTVTLSLYYRAGANFSGTGLATNILTGTGTDQALRGGYTGQSGAGALQSPASTAWRRVTVTGTIPASATQIGVSIAYTPTGTAGAADYVDITGVQLERGSVATLFEMRPLAIDLQLAQRYFETFTVRTRAYMSINDYHLYVYSFKTSKRTVPIPTNGYTVTTGVYYQLESLTTENTCVTLGPYNVSGMIESSGRVFSVSAEL